MNKKIVIIIGAVLFIFMLWFGASSINKLIEREMNEKVQGSLNVILNSLGVGQMEIKPTVLFFFNSECEHCQWEVKQTQENIGLFKGYQLLFVSFEPRTEAIDFLRKHNLSQYYLEAAPDKVMSTFKGGVPQTFIYKNDNLVKHFKGEVKIEAILNALQN
ncbi:MAG: redoxin domain-containing protein [Cyclobacteriaceae bacterium]|uniref:peroxiredoxin family protein n=1 Tax=Fulvivirga sp. TaxID=1931237 RepID=UPI0032EF62D0